MVERAPPATPLRAPLAWICSCGSTTRLAVIKHLCALDWSSLGLQESTLTDDSENVVSVAFVLRFWGTLSRFPTTSTRSAGKAMDAGPKATMPSSIRGYAGSGSARSAKKAE